MRSRSIRRLLLAGLAVAALLALLAWQHSRERVMSACAELGGRWDGAASTCRFPDGRIILRRELQRG